MPTPEFPTDHYGLVRRSVALRNDISDAQISAAVLADVLIRLADGVYAPATESLTGPDDGGDHLYRLRSIAVATSQRSTKLQSARPPSSQQSRAQQPGEQLQSTKQTALSHDSAAALLGLPTLKPEREIVHFTNGQSSGGFARGLRHVHAAPIYADHTTLVDGLVVTTLERTAVDIAVAGTFAQALVVFDAALRLGADRAVMAKMLKSRRRQGITTARRALKLADGLSESVGESWSRAHIIEADLAMPRLQNTFLVEGQEYRTDFDWNSLLIGEFDGKLKYGRCLRPGETLRDALIREKAREDALRRVLGAMVLRWTWAMLERGEVVPLVRRWLNDLDLSAA